MNYLNKIWKTKDVEALNKQGLDVIKSVSSEPSVLNIGFIFTKNDLKNFFLTECIYTTLLKPFGYTLQKYSQVSETEISFSFIKDRHSTIDTKLLNLVPSLLYISNYGWSCQGEYILEDSSKFPSLEWDYKHGKCTIRYLN